MSYGQATFCFSHRILLRYCLRGIITRLSEPFGIEISSISLAEGVTRGGGLPNSGHSYGHSWFLILSEIFSIS